MADFLGISDVLGTLKGKALELKDIEYLKSAYKLQEDNLTQYKTSNEAYRENAELLRAKNDSLNRKVEELEAQNAQLSIELSAARNQILPARERVSRECEEILRIVASNGRREVDNTDVSRALRKPQTAIDHLLDILDDRGLINLHHNYIHSEIGISLTKQGREYSVKHRLIEA